AHWVVTHLADLLAPLAGGLSGALAIVVLTIIVRTCLIPVGVSGAKAGMVRARMAPKIAELNRRYKNDRQLLQQKTMQAYAQEGASPVAGCLPALVQMPVLMGV